MMRLVQPVVPTRPLVMKIQGSKRTVTTVKIPNKQGTYRLRYKHSVTLLNVVFAVAVLILSRFIKDEAE